MVQNVDRDSERANRSAGRAEVSILPTRHSLPISSSFPVVSISYLLRIDAGRSWTADTFCADRCIELRDSTHRLRLCSSGEGAEQRTAEWCGASSLRWTCCQAAMLLLTSCPPAVNCPCDLSHLLVLSVHSDGIICHYSAQSPTP